MPLNADVGSGVGSFISLGAQYAASDCSFRVKFRINTDVAAHAWMPVVDSSNGAYADGLLVTAAGNVGSLMVNITVCRGVLQCQSIIGGPIDSSRYWVDLYVVMDAFSNIKIYNWGKLINYGKLWLPIPGMRRFTLLGASSDPTAQTPYIVDGAIQLFQYFPVVKSSAEIRDLYTNDKPPLVLASQTGSLFMMNAALATSFVWYKYRYSSRAVTGKSVI